MIPMLLQFLQQYMKIPAVYTYLSTQMILAALTSLLITIFCGPRFISKLYEWKIGQHIRKEDCPLLGELHKKKQDTPTMGGILILFSLLISLILWMNVRHFFTFILFLTTVWVGMIGAVDDYLKLKLKNTKGLTARRKMLFQVIFSLILSFFLLNSNAGSFLERFMEMPVAKESLNSAEIPLDEYQGNYFVPFLKKPVVHLTGLLAALFIFVVVSGASNAVNLTDGLDGLASGLIFLCALVFAVVAFLTSNQQIANYLNIYYIEGSGEIAIFLSSVCGASLGFLWYNGHPAQVFMGDTGSLSLGAILGVSSILLRREVLLAIVGGLFVMEAISVILQVLSYKCRNKTRIFLCAPLHHHFEYKGWPETKVVLRFWIIGIILAMIGFASLKFQ